MYVLVTTEFRGVFFGKMKEDKAPAEVTLEESRNCIYWASSVGGVFGLAATGPNDECRLGPVLEQQTFYKITSVTPCSDEAVKAWQSA